MNMITGSPLTLTSAGNWTATVSGLDSTLSYYTKEDAVEDLILQRVQRQKETQRTVSNQYIPTLMTIKPYVLPRHSSNGRIQQVPTGLIRFL